MTNNEIAMLIGRSEGGAIKALQHRARSNRFQQIMAQGARITALLSKNMGTDGENWGAYLG